MIQQCLKQRVLEQGDLYHKPFPILPYIDYQVTLWNILWYCLVFAYRRPQTPLTRAAASLAICFRRDKNEERREKKMIIQYSNDSLKFLLLCTPRAIYVEQIKICNTDAISFSGKVRFPLVSLAVASPLLLEEQIL